MAHAVLLRCIRFLGSAYARTCIIIDLISRIIGFVATMLLRVATTLHSTSFLLGQLSVIVGKIEATKMKGFGRNKQKTPKPFLTFTYFIYLKTLYFS